MELQITDEQLEIAVDAATSAGDTAASMKHTADQERKGNNTLVTEADRKAEAIVREAL